MKISELQKMPVEGITKYNKKHDTEHKRETTFPHLIEEVGELSDTDRGLGGFGSTGE